MDGGDWSNDDFGAVIGAAVMVAEKGFSGERREIGESHFGEEKQ